jgi:hypothetical protein
VDGSRCTIYADASNLELSRKQLPKGSSVAVRVVDPTGGAAGRAIDVELLGVHMNAFAE